MKIVERWYNEVGLKVNPGKKDLVLFSRRRTGSNLVGKIELFGVNLELSSKVKYLGVTLDSKLNWIAHTEDKGRKALAAFWICRKSFGRNWGLPSKAILWLYEAVIRPMISHGSVVWWPRLDVGRARRELGEIQRLVCICVTGAMKTTATAAMETLLNLPPLDLMVKAKAFATADRLKQNRLWTPNFNAGHGKIWKLISNPVFEMPRDRITPKIDFTRRFTAEFPSRQEWQNGWPDVVRGKVRFTDGSKTSEGSGAGVFDPETGDGKSFNLETMTSVPQAEIFAVLMAAIEALPRGTMGRETTFCIDNEGMIKALTSPVVTSGLVKECKDYLNEMGRYNNIRLVWVPGHSGVEGNERADVLANTGSATLPDGPEPFLSIPESLGATALAEWVKERHAERWTEYDGGEHTKRFLPKPNAKWTKDLLSMDRSCIARVVGAVTGHCGLNRHMSRLRLSATTSCSCGLGEETGTHLICECPKFTQLRRRLLGGYEVQPSEVVALGPVTLNRFLVATGRLS